MEQEPSPLFDMELDDIGQRHLQVFGKWARFLAILGFVCMGILVLVLLASPNALPVIASYFGEMEGSKGGIVALVFIAFVGTVIYWLYLLLKAANQVIKGVETKENIYIQTGFKALQVFFILSIVFSAITIFSSLIQILTA